MTKENIVTLTASPSEGTEAKRNKKTQLLSALLSASALGVFLEGCSSSSGGGGGGNPDPVTPDPVTPDPVTPDPVTPDPVTPDPVTPDPVTPDPVLPDPVSSVTGDGSESNPYLATSAADSFTGSGSRDWVSYAGSNAGVTIDLDSTATVSGGWAAGDNLRYIDNLIGSRFADTLSGDSGVNTLRGRIGDDDLYGGAGNDILEGGVGNDWLYGSEGTDTLDGGTGEDTANYLFSDEGVRVNLALTTAQQDFETNSFGFARSQGGDAVGDILTGIENIRGSLSSDWLTGDNNNNLLDGGLGNDRLEGSGGTDTYSFETYEGTDTVADDGGNIIFEPIGDDDYAGAIYTFTRANFGNSEAVTLTVTKGSNTLNVIKFTSDPSSYRFYIGSVSSENEIPASMLVVPPRVVGDGSESNPYLATAATDSFTGSGSRDWVSYAGSNGGVTIDLDSTATVSGGWATGDNLRFIDNLIGSRHADTLSGDSGVNTLRGGAGNDILDGGGGRDILEGGAGQDDYIFSRNSGDDTISSDPDGGRLLFRGHSPASDSFHAALDFNDNVVFVAGSTEITIIDGGANDAYQHGSYSVHYGTTNELLGNLYVGSDSLGDTLTGTSTRDIFTGFGGNDKLYGLGGVDNLDGGAGNDNLYGGADTDYVRGGIGNDLLDGGGGTDFLFGEGGADTYRFDALGTDVDIIRGGADDGAGNKLVFRAPSGVTYNNDNFAFIRGNFDAQYQFTRSSTGDDLYTIVFTGSTSNPNIRSAVYIEDYFDQGDNAYTIYRTGYNSLSDGTIVSTQPSELA